MSAKFLLVDGTPVTGGEAGFANPATEILDMANFDIIGGATFFVQVASVTDQLSVGSAGLPGGNKPKILVRGNGQDSPMEIIRAVVDDFTTQGSGASIKIVDNSGTNKSTMKTIVGPDNLTRVVFDVDGKSSALFVNETGDVGINTNTPNIAGAGLTIRGSNVPTNIAFLAFENFPSGASQLGAFRMKDKLGNDSFLWSVFDPNGSADSGLQYSMDIDDTTGERKTVTIIDVNSNTSITGGVGVFPNNSLTVVGTLDVTTRIGIATTNPANPLDVVGDASISGSLGIGTENPSSTLTVVGSVNISSTVTGSPDPSLFIEGQGNANVGIGTANPGAKLEVNGFTKLGSDAPSVKLKKFTGTTPASEGGQITAIVTGIGEDKIIGFTAVVWSGTGFTTPVPPEFQANAKFQYSVFHDSAGLKLKLHPTNSGNILSQDFAITLMYEP